MVRLKTHSNSTNFQKVFGRTRPLPTPVYVYTRNIRLALNRQIYRKIVNCNVEGKQLFVPSIPAIYLVPKPVARSASKRCTEVSKFETFLPRSFRLHNVSARTSNQKPYQPLCSLTPSTRARLAPLSLFPSSLSMTI